VPKEIPGRWFGSFFFQSEMLRDGRGGGKTLQYITPCGVMSVWIN